jgi:hypothetical protein
MTARNRRGDAEAVTNRYALGLRSSFASLSLREEFSVAKDYRRELGRAGRAGAHAFCKSARNAAACDACRFAFHDETVG